MAIRNNYKNFILDEIENIKVTAAHEYYHAVQFGYDGWENLGYLNLQRLGWKKKFLMKLMTAINI